MKRVLVTLIIVVVVVAYASTCFVAVDQTEFVVIKRFGAPVRTALEPGLQFKAPLPFESVVRLDNRLQVLEDPAAGDLPKEYLTRDKKNVEVASVTCWRIGPDLDSVLRFIETVGDRQTAETRLADAVKSLLNTQLGSVDFDSLVSTNAEKRRWAEVVEGIRNQCATRAMRSYGIEVVDLRLLRLNFPAQNRRSVFDRMRAERERIATQYRSEGEAEAMRIRAEAQTEQTRITSEAGRQAEVIRGQADAEATRVYGEAYGAAPEFYKFLRTLESYEKSIDEKTVLILPAEADYFRLLTQPETQIEALPEPEQIEKLIGDGKTDAEQPIDPQG